MQKLSVTSALLALSILAAIAFPGCSVNVKKDDQDEDKNVDISTPVGGIHVSKEADPNATGLAIYPGAKLIEKDDKGDDKSANVNINTPFFGLKVVAQEYRTDASQDKLISYYTGQLSKFGSVLQCKGSWHGGHTEIRERPGDHKAKQLTCDEGDKGDAVELKVGTEDNQHLVAVAPDGKGSKFALVRVVVRGKEDMI
ncbi:MAG TPA: hypothetical protein VFI95_21295 [Terriglobales bacterium]|nr:hypothetical protein [Terriglobales bacterium]